MFQNVCNDLRNKKDRRIVRHSKENLLKKVKKKKKVYSASAT